MDLETASQRMISPKPRSHVKRDGFEGTHAGNMRSMSPKCRYILPKAENTPVGLKTEWRRGWDLNPRYSFPYTALPMPRLRPLGHLSTALVVRPLRSKVAEGAALEVPYTGNCIVGSNPTLSAIQS